MTKKTYAVYLDEKTVAWIKLKIREKRFASVSHAIEYAIEQLKKSEA